MVLQSLDISLGAAAQHNVFPADKADAHSALHFERTRDDTRAVELAVDDARADREAVKTDDKAEQRGTVAHLNGFRHIEHTQQLLREIERVALALLENQIGIGFQLFERDARLLRKRMVFVDENVRCGGKQLLERQLVPAQQLGEHGFIRLAQIHDAKLAPPRGHIVDDLTGLRFAQDKAVAVGVELLHDIDKGVDREGIVLARHAELGLALLSRAEMLLHEVGLLQQLPRERQKLLALARHGHALVRAHERRHAHFLFQIVYRRAQARLRDEQALCRVRNVAAFRNRHQIA